MNILKRKMMLILLPALLLLGCDAVQQDEPLQKRVVKIRGTRIDAKGIEDKHELIYDYGSSEQLKSAASPLAAYTFDHNGDGLMTSYTVSHNDSSDRMDYTYTDTGLISSLKNYNDDVLFESSEYIYDSDSLLLSIERRTDSAVTTLEYSYSERKLSRLTYRTVNKNDSSDVYDEIVYDYVYDDEGRLIKSMERDLDPVYGSTYFLDFTYDENSRINTMVYDYRDDWTIWQQTAAMEYDADGYLLKYSSTSMSNMVHDGSYELIYEYEEGKGAFQEDVFADLYFHKLIPLQEDFLKPFMKVLILDY